MATITIIAPDLGNQLSVELQETSMLAETIAQASAVAVSKIASHRRLMVPKFPLILRTCKIQFTRTLWCRIPGVKSKNPGGQDLITGASVKCQSKLTISSCHVRRRVKAKSRAGCITSSWAFRRTTILRQLATQGVQKNLVLLTHVGNVDSLWHSTLALCIRNALAYATEQAGK